MVTTIRRPLGYVPNQVDRKDKAFGSEFGLELQQQVPDELQLAPVESVPLPTQAAQSCVGYSVAGVIDDLWALAKLKLERPSAGFIWWVSRKRHGAEKQDTGTYIRTSLQAARKVGYCEESRWPSLGGKDLEMYDVQPNRLAFKHANDQKMSALSFTHIFETGHKRVDAIKLALYSRFGVVVGMMVDSAFMQWNGVGTIAPPSGRDLRGGHAMRCGGRSARYDKEGLWLPGTWGPEYGAGGWHHVSWDAVASDKVVDVAVIKAPPKFTAEEVA